MEGKPVTFINYHVEIRTGKRTFHVLKNLKMYREQQTWFQNADKGVGIAKQPELVLAKITSVFKKLLMWPK